jgi:hypothetical protein
MSVDGTSITVPKQTRIWLAILAIAGAYLVWRGATVGNGRQYVVAIDGRTSAASVSDIVAGAAEVSAARTVGTWVAALLTLCVLSFLYGDNPLYKTAEAILIGVSAAYWMVLAFWDVVVPNLLAKIWPALIQQWALPGLSSSREPLWFLSLMPLALGVMLLWRLAPKGTWIARWPLAFTIGAFSGLKLVAYLHSDFLSQIRNSVLAIGFNAADQFSVQRAIEQSLLLACTLICLVYFFFSAEHKGVVGRISKVGIWVLMITFGAGFAYTVMGRIALLAIRLEFLFDDWLWLIDPANRRIGL